MVEITLSLPDHLYQHAQNLSTTTHLEIPNILIDALGFTLPTLDGVLATATKQLDEGASQASPGLSTALESINTPKIDDEYLSDLLFQHRESEITITEAAHAFSLMLMYHHGWLHQNGCHPIAAMLETAPGQLEP
ncbi:MAG: hypothetical protein ACREOI_12835 [bacterium]